MKELRKNEFMDMLEMNEYVYFEYPAFIKCDIPSLGEITYYPKANRVQISKTNKWENDGLLFIKNHIKNLNEKSIVKKDKINCDIKTIYNMDLHETIILNDDEMFVTRVAGGWIYERQKHLSNVFVPYNNEFQER